MIFSSFLSQSDSVLEDFSISAGSCGLPNRPRLKETVAHTVSKASSGQFLRHEADERRASCGSR